MDDGSAGTSVDPRDVHDFWPRLLVSPILGALVVNLSGLIDHSQHSTAGLIASYVWFAAVAFLIWEGNRTLYFRLPRREDWLLRPWKRLGVLLALITIFTIPFATATLWGWRKLTGDIGTRQYALATALFAVVALVVAITHVYETVFLLKDWESDRMRSARLEHARLQVELESLGREVDPHFLFNNLNALVHLVDQRSDAATGFIRTLSATYRYVLDCRARPLVRLAEELEALERHRVLAEIRYGDGFRLDLQIHATDAERLLLPPVSLGELFQNALKHNTITSDHPLRIGVRLEDATLIVENNLRSGPRGSRPAGIGLTNLRERFRIATGRTIVWGIEHDRFIVRLPLVSN
ncbi:MAG TPA: histidine kinase [Vicinamibacterales bacterium]|jgi:two-component system, LytTR family, sensor kinase|nr:histidine kinase [Vicinamibacterales bacterium]